MLCFKGSLLVTRNDQAKKDDKKNTMLGKCFSFLFTVTNLSANPNNRFLFTNWSNLIFFLLIRWRFMFEKSLMDAINVSIKTGNDVVGLVNDNLNNWHV